MACILLARFEAVTVTTLTTMNVHRLFLVALLVATKYLDDVPPARLCDNARELLRALSAVGGVAAAELEQLEIAMLMLLGFDMSVSPCEYHSFCVINCAENSA
eukprot:TRINITY_DN7515_c0_g1_i1.p4 TRINITY_DN7515_c0_g1~~TRINITY_DN7515_c0_g1_i1.p4  ORF type:complete len:103 (-),score=34.23 TRINITY_DN7515_c0_g1_i1:1186-1494(-)